MSSLSSLSSFVLPLMVAGSMACGGGASAPSPAAAQTPVVDEHGHEHDESGANHAAESGHAPQDFVPGSHADWCGEHAVPESLCTRCNPQLIAAFKATGDWCPEHGLPESQCLLCNPGLKIERPPKTDEAKP